MKCQLTGLLLLAAASASAEQWVEVQPASRPITVSASGVVQSADSIRFGPPATRSWRLTITQIAREGSIVKEGDVLAQFDSSSRDDDVREARAGLNAKRSELESLLEMQSREIEERKVVVADAVSRADKARRKANVDANLYAGLEYQKLVEERNIAEFLLESEQERSKLQARVRDAKVAELEADIVRLQAELVGAERDLAAFTIRAPRAGLVIVGTDQAGQKLGANDQTNPGITVVELANPNELIVKAEVPEFAATKIAVGQSASLVIDAAGGTPIAGEVIEVGSIVRRQSQFSQAMVRDVTVTLPKEQIANLRPGMTVKLTIEVDRREAALAVPESAIQYRDGRPGVRVRGDGWRDVSLGRESAGLFIVDAGLEPGERIAVE
ncbi:MAG: HlyD family efflux transporter periplasmic adaptor subunit [Pseudomonadota bacterium]